LLHLQAFESLRTGDFVDQVAVCCEPQDEKKWEKLTGRCR